jgi:hypothetical protein
MDTSLHAVAVATFAPMLESLSGVLDKGAAHARKVGLDLVEARLAPDMFTLAQQVQLATFHAQAAMTQLAGNPAPAMENAEKTFDGMKAQVARAVAAVRATPERAFEGAAARDCSIAIPGDLVIEMDGSRFLVGWALPHFYFHVVTAYDILRHRGVPIGKQDYASGVGAFIRPKRA